MLALGHAHAGSGALYAAAHSPDLLQTAASTSDRGVSRLTRAPRNAFDQIWACTRCSNAETVLSASADSAAEAHPHPTGKHSYICACDFFSSTGTLSNLMKTLHSHATQATKQQQQQTTQQHQRASGRQLLSWQELHRAAQIAAWSGLCYLMPDDLAATIRKQHAGLTLVASGRNGYTSWYVADGVVPAGQFCTTISSRSPLSSTRGGSRQPVANGTSSNGSSNGSNGGGSTTHDPPHSTQTALSQTPAAAAGWGVCARVPQGTRERFVFLRGVQWSAPDIASSQLSQALMNLWPTQFPAGSSGGSNGSGSNGSGSNGGFNGSNGGSPLVAHAGVAGIAQELFAQLRPYLQQADDVGMPLCFAGHSLGGSLAMLMMVQHQMHRKDRRRTPVPSCYTFGSPPVLAHAKGGGGGPVLQVLGLPADAVNSFVLDQDPVPRALLSVDPTFELLSGWSAVKGLLQLRELFVGSGSPLSPGRFLFEAVGQVHLIKWTPEGGAQVVPLDATEIEQELSLLAPLKGGSSGGSNGGSHGGGQQPTAAVGASTPGQQLQQQAQEAPPAAPAAAAGGAAAALISSARAWLDHHHRSYAQELEAAALRAVREQLAAEQRQQEAAQQ